MSLFPAPTIPSRLSANPQPRPKQPSPLQALLASVPHGSPPTPISSSSTLTAATVPRQQQQHPNQQPHQQELLLSLPKPRTSRPKDLRITQSEYAIHMARQTSGNTKPAPVVKAAATANQTKSAVAKNKPSVKTSSQSMATTLKPKPAAQVKSKAVPKVSPKPAQSQPQQKKVCGDDLKKLARFDWLLRQFLNSANALQDEFGGIPDQIRVVADGFGKHHGKSFPAEM